MRGGAATAPPSPGAMLHVKNVSFPGDLPAGKQAYATAKSPPRKQLASSSSPLSSRGSLGPAKAGARRLGSPGKVAAAAAAALIKVGARPHSLCQTEPTLLEPLEIPTGGTVSTQTDSFVRRPAPPPSELLAKRGVDAATSIEPGDLYDFDREVAPILELLVGRVLAEAKVEAEGELRLEAAWQRRGKVEEARYWKLVEVQRMEGDDRRAAAAKAAQERELRERAQRAADLAAKLEALRAAWGVAQGVLAQAVYELAPPRPSTVSSMLSLGGAAEEEVLGFLEEAGIQALQAMRASTPGALSAAASRRVSSLLASSRSNSRRSTAQGTGFGPRGSLLPPPEPRSATAMAGELVGRVLQQVETEAAAGAAAGAQQFVPSPAAGRELVGQAMEQVDVEAGTGLAGGAERMEQAADTGSAEEGSSEGAEEASMAAASEPALQQGEDPVAAAGEEALPARPLTAVAKGLATEAIMQAEAGGPSAGEEALSARPFTAVAEGLVTEAILQAQAEAGEPPAGEVALPARPFTAVAEGLVTKAILQAQADPGEPSAGEGSS